MSALAANTQAQASGHATLTTERQRLRAVNYTRAYTTIAIVNDILTSGHVPTALRVGIGQRFSWSALRHAAGFARDIAPKHRQQLQELLAILAVATTDLDPRFAQHFAPAHLAQLAQIRSRLTPQEESWAKERLYGLDSGQPPTFSTPALY